MPIKIISEHLKEYQIHNPYGGGIIDLKEINNFEELRNLYNKYEKISVPLKNKIIEESMTKIMKKIKQITRATNFLSC